MEVPKCLTKKCQNDAGTRGLCSPCYSTARIMMKTGQATEAQLISKGMMEPKHIKAGSLFREQFNNF